MKNRYQVPTGRCHLDHKVIFRGAILWSLYCTNLAYADDQPHRNAADTANQTPEEAPKSAHFSGEWNGKRNTLEEQGIGLALVYKGEFSSVRSGGFDKKLSYLDNLDFKMNLDAEKMAGRKGLSFFFYGIGNHGGHPSESVGDAQGTSNIETATPAAKIYEIWIQQNFLDDEVSVLAGLHDLNSEFYVTDTSGLFLNASLGIGRELSQTGINGPSIFPTTAPAVRLRIEPTKSISLQAGIFNGQAGDPENPKSTVFRLQKNDGKLLINELAYIRGRDSKNEQAGKYAIGIWAYTRTFDSQKSLASDGIDEIQNKKQNRGAYILIDQSVSSNVSAFIRSGIASTEVNRFASCQSLGLAITGVLPSRPDDKFGVAATRVKNGIEYRETQPALGEPVSETETTIESTYRFAAAPGLAIQPDLQYIIHPNTDAGRAKTLVGMIRFELSF